MRYIAMIVCALLSMTGIALSQPLPNSVAQAKSAAVYHKNKDFTKDIDRAHKMLESMRAGFTTEPVYRNIVRKRKVVSKKVIGHKLESFYILLAMQRFDNDEIKVVRIDEDGENPAGFVVDWAKFNGVNTKFLVEKPEGYAVLAIKRVIRSGRTFREVSYTPFSDELDTEAMRKLGMDRLRSTLVTASTENHKLGVVSRALPDMPLKDLVPTDVALTLAIIEHIDPARSRKEPIEKLINEVLVIVAANRDKAYAYAVSKAKARGLFQFIPITYATIVERYASARLIPAFVPGMNNHVNAAKASLLLFDSDLAVLPTSLRREIIKDKVALAKYLAIAYNSGARRAARAYKDGAITPSSLPLETTIYLEKEQKVRHALNL